MNFCGINTEFQFCTHLRELKGFTRAQTVPTKMAPREKRKAFMPGSREATQILFTRHLVLGYEFCKDKKPRDLKK